MSIENISTPDAPRTNSPNNQTNKKTSPTKMVFCSGQIPLDAKSGEFVGAGDVRIQTATVMKNLNAVLTAAGASFADVVKTTIFLTDLSDFAAVNEIYGRHFPTRPPARATVQVAALPKGALVEIEAIAVIEA